MLLNSKVTLIQCVNGIECSKILVAQCQRDKSLGDELQSVLSWRAMNQAHLDGDHHQLEKCTCMHHPEPSLNSSMISPDMYLSKGQKKVEQKKVWLPLLRGRGHDVTESRSLVIDAIASPI